MSPENKKENPLQETTGSLMQHDPFKDEEPFVLLDHQEDATQKGHGAKKSSQTVRFGLALDDHHVTLAATESLTDSTRLLESASAEIGGKSAAALTLAIREAAKKMHLRPRSVELVLPAKLCEYQVISLPPMEVKERANYLRQLASKSLSDRDACYTTIALAETALSTEVLLVASPRDEVESLVRACHQAGLVPERVLPPFAPSLNLLSREMAGKKDPAALVDQLSQDEVNLIVWDEGKVRVHRNIRKSGGSDRWEEFLDSEVYRTVAYYRTHSGGRRVNRIIITYSSDDVAAMQQRFEAVGMFESGVVKLAVEGCEASQDSLVPLAAAAASNSEAYHLSQIDMMPAELRHPRRTQLLTALTLSLASLALAGEIFIFHSVRQGNQKRQEAVQASTQLNQSLSHYEQAFQEAEAKKTAFKKRVHEFDTLKKQRVPLSPALVSVLSIPSDQIYLKSLAVQANGKNGAYEIVLTGAVDNKYAKDKELEIDRYLSSLRQIPGVRAVDRIIKNTGAPVQGGTQREQFEIRVIFPTEFTKP